MKYLIPIFFVFSTLTLSAADVEMEMMHDLVTATQKSLKDQKELLASIAAFKQMRAAFVEEPTSRKYATQLVKAAIRVQNNLDNSHLAHLFSNDFLQEIQFFNQLGTKHTP